MAKTNKNRNKYPAMITYIVAVLSLLVGLILPLSTRELAAGGLQFNNMPLLQLPSALVALGATGNLQFGSPLSPSFSYKIPLFGSWVNIGAILLLAYIFVTALALIILIPVCIAKKNRPFVRKIVAFAEIAALVVLLALVACQLLNYSGDWNLSVFIPFGVTLLMLIVQSIIYFKGSGVIKTIALVLSAVAAFAVIGNIVGVFPDLVTRVDQFFARFKIGRPFKPTLGLYSLGEVTYFGHTLFEKSMLIPAENPEYAVINILALILTVLVCLDLLFNLFGLGKRTGKGMLKFNLVRYVVEFLLTMVLYGFVFWLMGNFGFCLYLLTAVALIQLIIAIARLACFGRAAAFGYEESAETGFDEEYEYIPAQSAAPEIAAATPAVRSNAVYKGPTDEFIQKLNNEQKSEFAKTFIEHDSGSIDGIPDYVVGGDNSKFFSSIFIYLARVRDLISDGLMDKLYEEVNLI